MATEVQIALQPQAGQDPTAALTAAAAKLARTSLEMLVQQAGQPLTGRILPPTPQLPAGFAQIAVADIVLTLKLSTPLPTGTPVRIDVQQNPAGQPAVTVQPLPPNSVPAPASPAPAPVPQTTLPLPPAPPTTIPPTPPVASPPAPAATSAPAPPQTVAQAPAPQPAPAPPAAQQAAAAPAQPALMPATPSPTPAIVAQPAVIQAPSAPTPPPIVPPTTSPPQTANSTPPVLNPAPVAATPSPPPASAPLQAPTPPQPPTPAAQPQVTQSVAQPLPPSPAPVSAAPAAPQPPAPVQAAQPQVATPPPAPAAPAPAPAPPPVLMQRLTQAFAPPAAPAASSPPLAPGSPAQLVMAATTQAAAQQQSPAPLLQALAVALPQLPKPVADAAARVLATRVSLDRDVPTGESLKQAVLRSGVFLDAPAKAAAPPDLRQALTQLRGTLLAWLGDDIAPVAAIARRPPPPARGSVPRGQSPELPQPVQGEAKEAGKSLLGQTEGALARIKLMQLSSQPAEAARPGAAMAAPGEWNLELPLLLGRELAMAQIQIQRDGKGKAEPKERGWRLRFALKFSVLGEVGAQVAMVGSRTSIAIWADEEATAATLDEMLPELAPALAAKGLELVSLSVRRGVPRDENQPAGKLMDSMR